MPARLRPTAPIAADAILVGDPGRALLLAQELLEKPKMSNHARGLWGYTGRTAAGEGLTIQATGTGGPSAAMVVTDLAELGVKRAIRVGTCVALDARARCGDLLLPREAIAAAGSATAFGLAENEPVQADPALFERLSKELEGELRAVPVTSLDRMPPSNAPAGVAAADMQSVAVLASARELDVMAAAVLIVSEAEGATITVAELESTAKRAGEAAAKALSNPRAEG
jgi:uridine phosphorylase